VRQTWIVTGLSQCASPHQPRFRRLENERRFIALGLLKHGALAPYQSGMTLEHRQSNFPALAFGPDSKLDLAPTTQVSFPAGAARAPDVMPKSPFQHNSAVPRKAASRPCCVAKVKVQVQVFCRRWIRVCVPRACVHKEPILEDKEMRIGRVTLFQATRPPGCCKASHNAR